MMDDDDDEVKDLSTLPGNSKKPLMRGADNLRPNSFKSKEIAGEISAHKRKKVKKIVKGKVIRKKRSFLDNVSQTFLGEDTKNVGAYILYDVLIPAAKNTIQEMISSGIEMLLFGETRSSSRSRKDKNRSIVSYSSFYKSGRNEERSESHRSRGKYNLEEVIFESGREAADVLSNLEDLLEEYETGTVAEYYELAGVNDSAWTDNKWGWYDLKRARCVRVPHGYIIDLPKPEELD